MPVIQSLPHELLIQILEASLTIRQALCLSRVNKRFQAIWRDHGDNIAENIIKATIPAGKEAIAFAILETRLRTPWTGDEKPPLRLCYPTLMRNADLCASAHTACIDDNLKHPDSSVKWLSSPSSYYFIRRIMLAFDFTQIRDDLLAEIQAASEEMVMTNFHFTSFLELDALDDERARQGIPDRVEDHLADFAKPLCGDAWEYTIEVTYVAQLDRDKGFNDLPRAVQGYIVH